MYTPRLLNLLVLALAATNAVDASYIKRDPHELSPRQDDSNGGNSGQNTDILPTATDVLPGPGSGDDPPQTSGPPPQSSSAPPEMTDPPVVTTSVPPPDTTPPPTNDPPITTSDNATQTSDTPPESTGDRGNGTDDEPQFTQIISTSYKYITMTNSNGDVQVSTSGSVITSTAILNEGDNDGSGGMGANTRNTIIGVVVGIGGAIMLGALGVVAWRIRARKKLAEENDGLMQYDGGYTGGGKSETLGSSHGTTASNNPRSPFQSTLENYHGPTQPVNASSNF